MSFFLHKQLTQAAMYFRSQVTWQSLYMSGVNKVLADPSMQGLIYHSLVLYVFLGCLAVPDTQDAGLELSSTILPQPPKLLGLQVCATMPGQNM